MFRLRKGMFEVDENRCALDKKIIVALMLSWKVIVSIWSVTFLLLSATNKSFFHQSLC